MPSIKESTDINTDGLTLKEPPAATMFSAPPPETGLPTPSFTRGSFQLANPASADNLNYFYSKNRNLPTKRLLPPPTA